MGSKQKTTEKVLGTWRNTSEVKNTAASVLSSSSSKSVKAEHFKSEILEDSEIQSIVFRISNIFGVENGKVWLERPTLALNGDTPQAVIQSEDGRVRVSKLLDQIDQGFAA